MDKEQLLKKWLADDLTDSEQQEFKQLADYELNSKIIASAKSFKAPKFSAGEAYTKLQNQISNESTTPVIKLNAFKTLLKVAAVVLVVFSFFTLYRYNSYTTIETLAGEQTTFELPDASSVTLNAASKITYAKYRWKKKRAIELEGEAFFNVAHGKKFDVVSSGGVVSVLGTRFNVKNRANYFEVKCFEGLVSVAKNGVTQKLPAGKTYRAINNAITMDNTSAEGPNWMNKLSRFKSVPLYEVLNELERQYGINITTQGVDVNRLFTGSFVNNNLEQALANVTVPFSLNFKAENPKKIMIYSSE